MKKIRVADVIVDFLINKKVDTIFGLMGGGAMFLNDALALRSNKIKTIFILGASKSGKSSLEKILGDSKKTHSFYEYL